MVRETTTHVRRVSSWDDTPGSFIGELSDWSGDEDPFPYVLHLPTTVLADRHWGWRHAPERLFAFDGRRFLWCSQSEDDRQVVHGDAGSIISIEYGTTSGYSWMRLRRDARPDVLPLEFDSIDVGPVEDLLRDLRGLLTGVFPAFRSDEGPDRSNGEDESLRFLNAYRVLSLDGNAAQTWFFEPPLVARSLGLFQRVVEPAHALFVSATEIVAMSDLEPQSGERSLVRTFIPRRALTEAEVDASSAAREDRITVRFSVHSRPVLEMGFNSAREEELRLLASGLPRVTDKD